MVARSVLTQTELEKLCKIDTCTVSNAIERLKARLRNEGQISGDVVHCMFPDLPPVIGYAVTGCMRSTTAPVTGRAYHENMHWWRYVSSIPEPRIMVVQDRDDDPGAGALFGELHAVIGQALHCVAYVSNGYGSRSAGGEGCRLSIIGGPRGSVAQICSHFRIWKTSRDRRPADCPRRPAAW